MTILDIILTTGFAAIMLFHTVTAIALTIYTIRNQRNPIPRMCRDTETNFGDLTVEYIRPMSDFM